MANSRSVQVYKKKLDSENLPAVYSPLRMMKIILLALLLGRSFFLTASAAHHDGKVGFRKGGNDGKVGIRKGWERWKGGN